MNIKSILAKEASRLRVAKINYPLVIGIIIVLFLLVISFFPESFSKADPYGVERANFVFIDGKINYFSPPIQPCPEYPWGTDGFGRDMKSLIIYGCSLTLFTAIIVTLCRFFIALPLAFLAGYKNRAALWLIKQFNVIFSAFPLVIVVLLLSRVKLVTDFFKQPVIIVSYLLILFGWSRLAVLLKDKIEEILSQDFIEGEIAIGKNKWEIATQNIMPHIIPTIFVLFFLEIASVLLIMTQIGVFGVVLNGSIVNSDGDMQIPYTIDWASLLIGSQYYMTIGKLWLILYPAAAFSLSIIGFNLLGEGLRLEFEKRNSKIITWIRRVPLWISPLRFIYEIKNIHLYKKQVYTKTVLYLCILLLIFFPHAKSLYKFNTAQAMNTIEEISDDEHDGRRAGSGYNQQLSKMLAEQLKNYKLQPYDGKFIHSFPIENSFNIDDSNMKIISAASGETEFKFRKDYIVTTPLPMEGTYDLKYVTAEEVWSNFRQYDYSDVYKDTILLADARGLGDVAFGRYIGVINNFLHPKGLIYISDWKSEKEITKRGVDFQVDTTDPIMNISIASDKGDELLRRADSKVYLSINCKRDSSPKGENVIAYIPGSDKSLEDEVIIVGTHYDGVGNDSSMQYPAAMEAGGAAIELEAARILASSKVAPKRTVIFAFWDGGYIAERGSIAFLDKYFKNQKKSVFYIDLKNFGNKEFEKIMLDTTNTLPKDLLPQEYIKALKRNARRNEVKVTYSKIPSPVAYDFSVKDINSITIDSSNIDKDIKTPHDSFENIDKKALGKSGQVIVDTLYDIVCGGIKK